MEFYKKIDKLAYWFRYQATYLEMAYYLKQVLNGKVNSYIKAVSETHRGIGKTTALARLSAQYNIPIIVSTCAEANYIEKYIPQYFPKYFKKYKPKAIKLSLLGKDDKKYKIVLIDIELDDIKLEKIDYLSRGTIVGYKHEY